MKSNKILSTNRTHAMLYYVELPLSSEWLFKIGEKGEISITAIKARAGNKAKFQLDGFEFNFVVT